MSRTADAARGKWKGILLQLGMEAKALTGKHGPCPMCGGKDRFRFDNKERAGTWLCSQCGAGDGFKLLRAWKSWDFATAAREVDAVLGHVRAPDPVRAEPDATALRKRMIDLWTAAERVTPGDPVHRYLMARGVPMPQNTDALRYHPMCPVPNEPGKRMAMLAKVQGLDGAGVNLHRTFLRPDGQKADMAEPRATMPGSLPDGCAIRLSMQGERLGIAEGIETALKASERFSMPVWAAINATMLTKWRPPEGVREVVVFGDRDGKFGGQAAAYALAHRLATDERLGLKVEVRIPGTVGRDWADQDAA